MTTHNDAPTVAAQQCGLPEGLDATDMDMIRRGDMLGPVLGARVASLIQSQAAESAADKARIAELEAGLAPFSDMAGEMFARGWDVSRVAIALDNPNDPHRVTASDFFTARALLNRRAEG